MAGDREEGPDGGGVAASVLLAILIAFLLSGIGFLLLGPIHPWPGSGG